VAVRVGKEWRLSNGKPLPSHVPRNIPPAWTGVQVSTDPKSALVARGIDKKGRVQSVYSDAHAMKQAAVKFARVNELRRKADAIRKEITADLKSDDPATREGAAVLSLIEHAGLRPGSDADTGAEKQAYGATTLEGRHVVKTADGVRLRFVGKKGKDLDIPITDPAIAKLLLDRKAAAGNKGRLFNIDDAALRDYTHSKDGGSFKPKDFRTARGTSIAADAVRKMPAPNGEQEYKKAVREVAVAVSNQLGNTPVIALQSYIDPMVFAKWRQA
jgi:DNA topoisomerase-1